MTDILKPFFVIPHDLGDMVSGNARPAHPVFNLNRFKSIGLTWRSNGNSSMWARGDFGSARPVDFCSIIAANAVAGTKVRLRLGTSQADVDGGSAPYDSMALAFISPSITREDGLYHSHLEIGSVQTYRWWRVDITDHTGDFEASMLILGQKITPSKFYNYDWEYGIEDMGSLEITRFGVFDEEDGRVLRTIAFTLAWQTEAEWEGSFRPMMESLGKRGIVYCCFDPAATTYRQARSYLGIMAKPPFARGTRKPRTFAQDFSITSLI